MKQARQVRGRLRLHPVPYAAGALVAAALLGAAAIGATPATQPTPTGSTAVGQGTAPAEFVDTGVVPDPGQGRDLTGAFAGGQGHVTGHVDHPSEQWPPTPQGATNVRNLSDPAYDDRLRAEQDRAFAYIAGKIASARALAALRGRELTRLQYEDMATKAVADPAKEYRFFDRATNATITVVEAPSGALSYRTMPASQYQPEITPQEVQEATRIAKQYFLAEGITRVSDLQGFGIQAHPAEGQEYFDGRVVYISLHVNSDTDPEYVAWVDLTTGRVTEARREVPQ